MNQSHGISPCTHRLHKCLRTCLLHCLISSGSQGRTTAHHVCMMFRRSFRCAVLGDRAPSQGHYVALSKKATVIDTALHPHILARHRHVSAISSLKRVLRHSRLRIRDRLHSAAWAAPGRQHEWAADQASAATCCAGSAPHWTAAERGCRWELVTPAPTQAGSDRLQSRATIACEVYITGHLTALAMDAAHAVQGFPEQVCW